MRKYETFFILDPDLSDDATNSINDKLKNVVADNEGMVLSHVPWGKKKLAYTVKKHSRGQYVLMEYAGGSTLVSELERNMRLDDRVIKFITVKLQDRFNPEKEQAEIAPPTPPVFSEDEETGLGYPAGEEEDAVEDFDEDDGDRDEEGHTEEED